MKLVIETPIANNHHDIFKRFDLKLFKALKPPFTSIDVKRFDGCEKGHEVHLTVTLFGLIKQHWINHITETRHTQDEYCFVDRGVLMPFPLSYWEHTHIVRAINEKESVIIDHIIYKSRIPLIEFMMYPLFYLMFSARKPIYVRELT